MTDSLSPAALERQLIAQETAKMLLEVKAVLFNPEKPFIFTSGWASPVYIDMRKIISFPAPAQAHLSTSRRRRSNARSATKCSTSVAGGETAGIPFAAWMADRLALPMQYIRKKPKGFGRNAQIEGDLHEGGRALLVEDLATDGALQGEFLQRSARGRAEFDHAFVFFFYDIFPGARDDLAKLGITLHALATWWDVLAVARDSGYFEKEKLDEVERFLHEPAKWSAAHGGISDFKAAG